MSWILSRFQAGDLVEVRARHEILATLDDQGCVDGLPFMPEMMQFCGRRYRVRAVAHKTCDTGHRTYRTRGLSSTVHLADLRCDGAAHGGCEAACTLFWKDAWLKPVGQSAQPGPLTNDGAVPENRSGELTLLGLTQSRDPQTNEISYACQATRLFNATFPIAQWNLRQHYYDVTTGNHSVRRIIRVLGLAALRWPLYRVSRGYRVILWFNNCLHRWLIGRDVPIVYGRFPPGQRTPTGSLSLRPGELVRVKSLSEIEETLDTNGRNRGLSFDADEMTFYCGGVYRVRAVVTKIIDEYSGRLRTLNNPCVMLEGVVCNAEFSRCRLNCPRAIPSYWREIWLERVETQTCEPGDRPEAVVSAKPSAT